LISQIVERHGKRTLGKKESERKCFEKRIN